MKKNPRGVTLLMALLVLATVTGIGLAVSSLVVREVLQSKNIDSAITAYYGAEAGMERALFVVKNNRQASTTIVAADAAIDDVDTSNNPMIPAGAVMTVDGTVGQGTLLTNLKENETVQIDLFDPDAVVSNCNAPQSGVESVRFDWKDRSRGKTWIEMTVDKFDICNAGLIKIIRAGDPQIVDTEPTSLFARCNETVTFNFSCDSPAEDALCTCDTYTDITYSKDFFYRISAKALYGDITDLRITAYTHDDPDAPGAQPVDLTNRLQIDAKGTFQNASAKITTFVPWRPAAGGVFQFVLFSEESLIK